MKPFHVGLFCAILAVVGLALLMHDPEPQAVTEPQRLLQNYSRTQNGTQLVTRFDYNNHSYLQLGWTSGTIGTVHDPDCKCSVAKSDTIEY